jgi:hypothetical protein
MFSRPDKLAECYKVVKCDRKHRLIPLFNGTGTFTPGWNDDPADGYIQHHQYEVAYRKGFHCFTSRETAVWYVDGRDSVIYRWSIIKVLVRETDTVAGGIQRSGVSEEHETIVARSFYLPENEYREATK